MALTRRPPPSPRAVLLALLLLSGGPAAQAEPPRGAAATSGWTSLAVLRRETHAPSPWDLPEPGLSGPRSGLTPSLERSAEDESDGSQDDPLPLVHRRFSGGGKQLFAFPGGPWLRTQLDREERADLNALVRVAAARVHLRLEFDWGAGAEVATAQARPGQIVRLGSARVRRDLREYDPELACDNSGGLRPSALGNPGWVASADGWEATLRAFLVPGEAALALEALVVAGASEGPTERVRAAPLYLGDVDLPRGSTALLLGSGRLRPGETLTLTGSHAGRVVTVRIAATLAEDPPSGLGEREGREGQQGSAGPHLTRLPTDLLLAAPWEARLNDEEWIGAVLGDGLLAGVIDVEAVPSPVTLAALALLLSGGDEDALDVDARLGGTDLLGSRSAHAVAAARFAGLAAHAARTARLEFTLRRQGREVERLDLTALEGRTAAARVGRERAVLLEQDTEVG